MSDNSEQLDPARLFASPSLLGTPPQDLKFSPDGRYIVFRAPDANDLQKTNLHRIDLQTMSSSVWIESSDIKQTATDVTNHSAEERAERERRRDFSYGITSFSWRPGHPEELFIPLDGQGYLVGVDTPHRPRPVCPTDLRQSGFTWSASGQYLSYVRDRDLYFLDVLSGREQRVTNDASDTVQSGLPDFLAAEEMHRFQGHWWSKCDREIYFTRTDESTVAESFRLEVDAHGSKTVPQRYPFAGQANPEVELWVYNLNNGDTRQLWSSAVADEYLARCVPYADGALLLTQDRQQQQLAYRRCPTGGVPEKVPVYVERATSWVNLTNDLKPLDNGFITTDEMNGTRQIIILDDNGDVVARYDAIKHVNRVIKATADAIWACGWSQSPTDNHLFCINRTTGATVQLTKTSGWHEVALNETGDTFVDRYSSSHEPLTIEVVSQGRHQTIYSQRNDALHPYRAYLAQHVEAKTGSIIAADGSDLWYRITPPIDTSSGHCPTIIYVYGGPGVQKVRNEWNPLTNQLFAHQGFAVVELDNRGSTNRGRAFEAPLHHNMGRVEVEDQLRIFDVLGGFNWADLTRVGVFGHSYGGYMALMLLCQAPGKLAAGAAVAPVCDWRLYDTHYTERYMGMPTDNPKGYRHANVLTHLHALTAPLLLMHGMADDNVLFDNSTMIMAELQRQNKQFELMTYPGAKHSMQEPHVSVHRFDLILDFFRRTL